MKKQLIGALVAGLILFFWQFISFGLADLHGSQMSHMPQQDAVLQVLADNNVPEGAYYLPRLPMDADQTAAHDFYLQNIDKPWALLTYHTSTRHSQGSNMFRGFVIDFLSAFLLVWILLRMKDLDFKTAVLASLAVGTIGYLTINYLDSVWFESNSLPYLIDTVVQWGLVGAWLGWWLNRG